MSFDINKPYRTRGGSVAWAIALPEKMHGLYRFVGAYKEEDGRIIQSSWAEDGRWNPVDETTICSIDLINIPEKRTAKVWINIYDPYGMTQNGKWFFSRAEADRLASYARVACVAREISYEVGEGL